MAQLPLTLEYQPRTSARTQDAFCQNVMKEATGVRKRPGLSAPLDGGSVGQGLYWNGLTLYAVIDDVLYRYFSGQVSDGTAWTEYPRPSGSLNTNAFVFNFGGTLFYYENNNASSRWDVYTSTDPTVGWASAGNVPTASLPVGSGATSLRFAVLGSYVYAINNFDSYLTSLANRKVYRSSDGLTWTLIANPAAFGARTDPGFCAYAGKLWIAGGFNAAFVRYQDVWYSSDGITWTQATATASWGARSYPLLVSHAGYMFCISGWEAGGTVGDSWRTTDGVTWTLMNASAVNTSVVTATTVALSLNGYIFIVAGGTLRVYRSSDGANWASQAVIGASLNATTLSYLGTDLWCQAQNAVTGQKLYKGTANTTATLLTVVVPFSSAGAPTTAGLPFDITSINPSVSSAGIVLKSTQDMYYYNGSTLVKVT